MKGLAADNLMLLLLSVMLADGSLPLEYRFEAVSVTLKQKSVSVTMQAPIDEISEDRGLNMDLVFEWAKIGKVRWGLQHVTAVFLCPWPLVHSESSLMYSCSPYTIVCAHRS